MSTVSGNSDFIKNLSLYLDNELDDDQRQHFLQEADFPTPIPTLESNQLAYKAFLKKCVSHRKASPDLLEKIESQLYSETALV